MTPTTYDYYTIPNYLIEKSKSIRGEKVHRESYGEIQYINGEINSYTTHTKTKVRKKIRFKVFNFTGELYDQPTLWKFK